MRPELIDGTPQELPERAIWIGYQPTLDSLFPKHRFRLPTSRRNPHRGKREHLVIAGRDRWDPDHLVVEGIDEKIVGRQQEYGTVNAIYTFLQDRLGVRWLWPGELGEDVPQSNSGSRSSLSSFVTIRRSGHAAARSTSRR